MKTINQNEIFSGLSVRVFIIALLLLNTQKSKAFDFIVEGISYDITSETTCKVVAADKAFKGVIYLPSVVANNSVNYTVTAIGNRAFYDCGNMISINLPKSIIEIGEEAFGNCVSLSNITIPDNLNKIATNAFLGSNLQKLYIGECINTIGMAAFSSVSTVYLSSSITHINESAFEDADELVNIYIPSSIKEIEANAFAFCGKLQGVYINDIASWCGIKFGNQYANPTSKSGSIWLNDTHLTYLEIPDGVLSINDYAFYNCGFIYELKISDSVETIGKEAFKNCNRLSTLHFGKGLRYIGKRAIEGNRVLEIHTNDIDAFCQIDVEDFIFNQYESTNLFCNGELVNNIKLKEGINHIGKNIFRYYSKLASITMPNTLKTLGNGAFSFCTGLIKVVLSNSIKIIPNHCFARSHNLSKINMPSELLEIGDYAFSGVAMSKFILPSSTETIGEYAFEWCKADSIILSDGIKELKQCTFTCCKNLKYIYLGKSMQKIEYCFNYCENLKSISLPPSMVSLGMVDCPNLVEIYCYSTYPYHAEFSQNILNQATLYVPQGCKDRFLKDYQWNGFKEIIELTGDASVESVESNLSSFQIEGHRIIARKDARIAVYALDGKVIADRRLADGESITLPANGIYIIKDNGQTSKIDLR